MNAVSSTLLLTSLTALALFWSIPAHPQHYLQAALILFACCLIVYWYGRKKP